MKKGSTRWFIRTILCTVFLLTVFSFAPNIAHAKSAITCYKDGCDNTDPVVTGCGTSPSTVTTISTTPVYVGSVKYGQLEIRLSHAEPYGCNTIWARITAYPQPTGNYVTAYIHSNRTGSDVRILIYADQDTTGWSNQFGRDGTFYAQVCAIGDTACSDTGTFS